MQKINEMGVGEDALAIFILIWIQTTTYVQSLISCDFSSLSNFFLQEFQ